MGGFDVFRSDADGAGGWLPPVNLGYPLNTSDDDLFFFPTGKGETGYTYRYPKASAESDLVMVRMISPGNPARFTVRGSVSVPDDDTTGLRVRISNAADRSLISLIPLKAGTFSQALPAGEYTVDFTRNNMLLLQKSMRIPDFLPQDDLILTAELPATDKMTIDTIRLADILFEFDQSELSAKYNPLLDKLTSTMLKFPSLQVTLSGYSDARGNKTYNLKLSRARAEAVAMYLNRKPGIAPRVTIRAFGELNAVALNQTIEGEDLSEGRKYNRRVEIQLVPVTDGLVVETERDIPGSLRAK
jgi:outer membrane protein OmpA-like peptidoglycan-associated protein